MICLAGEFVKQITSLIHIRNTKHHKIHPIYKRLRFSKPSAFLSFFHLLSFIDKYHTHNPLNPIQFTPHITFLPSTISSAAGYPAVDTKRESHTNSSRPLSCDKRYKTSSLLYTLHFHFLPLRQIAYENSPGNR